MKKYTRISLCLKLLIFGIVICSCAFIPMQVEKANKFGTVVIESSVINNTSLNTNEVDILKGQVQP